MARSNRKKAGFFKMLGGIIGGFFGLLEIRIVIPLIEGIMRLWLHLDPRVYSERLRVRTISDGNLELKSNRHVILVLHAKAPLPAFTTNLIDALELSGLNLTIVSNASVEPIMKAWLLEKCHLLIERANLGRDFGAHKDAIRTLLTRYNNIERLILLNDSLFYLTRGLENLIDGLDGEHEFIGVTEVFQYHYHVQSFALSFGARVIRSKKFLQFWKKYRPISTRRWSIHKGEVSLTRVLTKAGFRPHILYQAAELSSCLRERPIREILESVQMLPTAMRPVLYEEFDRILGGNGGEESLAAIEAISQGVRSIKGGNRSGSLSQTALTAIERQIEDMDRWSFEIFTNKIVAAIAASNQMHTAGFLFVKYLKLPIIKRDIFYRDVFVLEDVYRILTELGEPLRDEAMADLRRAGTSAHLNSFLHLLYRYGSI